MFCLEVFVEERATDNLITVPTDTISRSFRQSFPAQLFRPQYAFRHANFTVADLTESRPNCTHRHLGGMCAGAPRDVTHLRSVGTMANAGPEIQRDSQLDVFNVRCLAGMNWHVRWLPTRQAGEGDSDGARAVLNSSEMCPELPGLARDQGSLPGITLSLFLSARRSARAAVGLPWRMVIPPMSTALAYLAKQGPSYWSTYFQ